MKLGILTAPFPETHAWRGGRLGRVSRVRGAGNRLLARCRGRDAALCRHRASADRGHDAGTRGPDRGARSARRGLSISGLGYYPNPLHADAAHRDSVIGHLKKVITAAALMNVAVVNTFVGGDRTLTLDQNWDRATQIFPAIVAHATDHGVTLAFENCPMIFSQDEWPGGHNIAYSPKIWRRIFETWGDAVGMNFDPSHLVWQMIDPLRFIREFGSRMVHVHAKDLMIDRDGLYENGIMSLGMGWQVPRMPGLGDVDWPAILRGPLPRRAMTARSSSNTRTGTSKERDDKIKRGFLLARDVLRPFVK